MLGAKRTIKRRVRTIGPGGEQYNTFNWHSQPILYKRQTGCANNTNTNKDNTTVINKKCNSFINNRKSLYCYADDCSKNGVHVRNNDIYKEPFEKTIALAHEKTIGCTGDALKKLRYEKAKRHIQNRRGVRNTNYNYSSKQYLERRQKALNKNVLGQHKTIEFNKSYIKEIGQQYFSNLKNYIGDYKGDSNGQQPFYNEDLGYEMKLYNKNKEFIAGFYIDNQDDANIYSKIYPTINILKNTYKGIDLQNSNVKTFDNESSFYPTSVCFESIDSSGEYNIWFNGYVLKNDAQKGCIKEDTDNFLCIKSINKDKCPNNNCPNDNYPNNNCTSNNTYMAGNYKVYYYSINKYNLHCGWDTDNSNNKKGFNQCNITNNYNKFIVKQTNPQFSKSEAATHGERLNRLKYQTILKGQTVVMNSESNNGALTNDKTFVWGVDTDKTFRNSMPNAVNGDYPVSLYKNTYPNYKKHLSGLSNLVGCHGKKNQRQRCMINDCIGPCLCFAKQALLQ